eukprot:m.185174 g.185174  ORF g.185174 m.185174 type:complete len:488 (-) comp25559_c0_seq3:48-1511(-)
MFRPHGHRPFTKCRNINEFSNLEKIGQGTFGVVYKAKDAQQPGKCFALKEVLTENQKDGFPVTALREIKILKCLRHPNVIELQDIVYGSATGRLKARKVYMLFEFMEHDLAGLLTKGTFFDVDHIMCLAKQLLEGLFYIHAAKLLHRDMKAANLLINKNGILRIADFGLARFFFADNEQKYTRTVCTRWYRPPEILLGERNYTTAIDMWGVGCLIGELFVREPILKGGDTGKDDSERDLDQYLKICSLCGTPNEKDWPGFSKLPCNNFVKPRQDEPRRLKERLKLRLPKKPGVSEAIDLIDKLLALDPKQRLDANAALNEDFFWTEPRPCSPSEIPLPSDSCHEGAVRRPAIPTSTSQPSTHDQLSALMPNPGRRPHSTSVNTKAAHHQRRDQSGRGHHPSNSHHHHHHHHHHHNNHQQHRGRGATTSNIHIVPPSSASAALKRPHSNPHYPRASGRPSHGTNLAHGQHPPPPPPPPPRDHPNKKYR